MSRPAEQEILEILDAYKDAPYRDITEKIGGTQYSVNVHFREDGRDLLGMLTGIFNRNISVFEYGYEDYGGYDDEE